LRTLTRVITTYAVVKKSTYVTTLALSHDGFSNVIFLFIQVVKVEPLDSLDKANLKLLDRPDLGITFTKVC
jgi:hypothetical protein